MRFVQFASNEKDNGTRCEIDITVASEDVDAALEEFYSILGATKNISVNTSDELIEELNKRIGSRNLKAAAKDYLLNKFTVAAAKQSGVDYAITPGVHAEADPVPHSNYSFTINLTVKPELTLSSIEPVEITICETSVDESDVECQLQCVAKQFAAYRTIKRDVLQMGDFAVMDVEMTVEHQELNKLSGKAKLIHIEKSQVPDGFIENVLGIRVGEIKKIAFSVPGIMGTTPDEYEATVVLREIREEVLPEIDDDFIKTNLPPYETLAEFKTYIRNDLEALKGKVDKQNLVFAVREALEKRLQGSIPDEMYEEAKEALMTSVVKNIEKQDKTIEEYCEDNGITKDAFNMNVFMQSSSLLRQNLALDLLAKGRGLYETDDDIAHAKRALPPSLSNLPDDKFEQFGYKKSLAEKIRRDKAVQWLVSTVVVQRSA